MKKINIIPILRRENRKEGKLTDSHRQTPMTRWRIGGCQWLETKDRKGRKNFFFLILNFIVNCGSYMQL